MLLPETVNFISQQFDQLKDPEV